MDWTPAFAFARPLFELRHADTAADVRRVACEKLAGDIFDHRLAVLPGFGLRLYPHPGGADVMSDLGALASLGRQEPASAPALGATA